MPHVRLAIAAVVSWVPNGWDDAGSGFGKLKIDTTQ
jgi:hypothetical protein